MLSASTYSHPFSNSTSPEMEIDFLGLSSPNFHTQQLNPNNIAFSDTASAGVETSLSLSTTTSFDYCQREILKFSEKKKKKKIWEFGNGDKMMTSSSSGSSISSTQSCLVLDSIPVVSTAGFLFDLNDKSTTLRNVAEIRAEPASLSIIYSGHALVFNDTSTPEKAEGTTYIAGKQSRNHARTCTRDGHTTTVAMARRATLARFLEKRFHRMNQARNCHLMGKSQNAINSEACSDTISNRSNKIRNNSLTRS